MSSPNKTLLPFFCLLVFLAFEVRAQETATIAFVNALPTPASSDFKYRGQSIRPNPFARGDISTSFQVPAGSFEFEVVDSSLGTAKLNLDLSPGVHSTAVVYLEEIKKNGSEEILRTIRVLTVPGSQRPGFRILSAGIATPISLLADGQPVQLNPSSLSKAVGGDLSLTLTYPATSQEWPVSVEQKGPYLVVLFPDPDGKFQMTLISE